MNLLITLVIAQGGTATVPQDDTKYFQADLAEIRELLEVVAKVTKKEFQLAMDPRARGGRCATDFLRDAKEPDKLFRGFSIALAAAGFGLVRDAANENRYSITYLGDPLPVVPPEYGDPDKLPALEEVCQLGIKLRHLTPAAAHRLVQMRLHQRLHVLAVTSSDTLTLVDFAPKLKQIARIVGDADKAAAEALRAVEIEFWLIGEANGVPVAPPAEVAAVVKDVKAPTVIGRGRARVSPTAPGESATGSVALNAGATISAQFDAMNDRGTMRLSNVRVMEDKNTLYRTAVVLVKPDVPVALSSWATFTLVVRAATRD